MPPVPCCLLFRRYAVAKIWPTYCSMAVVVRMMMGPKEQMEATSFALTLGRLGHESWRQVRTQWRQEQSDQLKMYHFRYKHERFLQELENCWATAIICTGQ